MRGKDGCFSHQRGVKRTGKANLKAVEKYLKVFCLRKRFL